MSTISIWLINYYQKRLSKYFGGHCVFEPSCSEYAKIAIKTNGFIFGWIQTMKRILRCKKPNGGYDYPDKVKK